MTRNECEKKLAEKLYEIKEIYKEYNPGGDYLRLNITNEYISACNEYYLTDRYKPVDFRQYNGEKISSRPHETGGNAK